MRYKHIIDKMTLMQKASLMSGKNFWETMDIGEHGIASIFLADGPHGIRKQAVAADHLGLNESIKATCFPPAATMANSWDVELGERMASALGREAVCQKVNVLLGPGLNIKRNPLCGRNFEYFSEDPYLAGKMAAAYIRGIQSNGIAACPKHFALNNQEERRMVTDSVADERAMREIYLTGFEIAVKEGGAKTIMSSYNKINGEYANENQHLLCDILRKEWGFDGVVVSDWGGNNDRVKALLASSELEMPTNGGDTNSDIIRAVESGELDESVLDSAVDRLLTLVFDTEKAFGEKAEFDKNAHHELALRAAQESIVLLKNENDILPLKKGARVAIIGDFARLPRFQGAGSSVVNPTALDDTIDCFGEYELEFCGFAPAFNRYGKKNGTLLKKAVRLVESADIALVYIGLDEITETEGLDRRDMKLPKNQVELLAQLRKTGKRIVAVISCGAAIEMDFEQYADAVVHCYLGGQAGARAALNVITGLVNPSGKLAESYPFSYQDCPSAAYFGKGAISAEYRESIFVGYRYYDTAGVKVRYPFGFGLSYTKFEYSDLTVTDQGAVFCIKNVGERAGAEVAQLYVSAKNCGAFVPKKELKGFAKVFLEPNESKQVEIRFDEYSFRRFNAEANCWESGCDYEIMIGASSADIRLHGALTVEGAQSQSQDKRELLPSYYNVDVRDVSTEEFERLLGRAVSKNELTFVKKKRIVVCENTAISDLRYARGFSGRMFAGGLRFAHWFLRLIGKRSAANVLMMGVCNMPVRGLTRMSGGMISWGQLLGLLDMFNGKFFSGLGRFMREGKLRKKRLKQQKKQQEN